ncbi:hypothetical protein EIK77_005123 [Talaromyces pinophilus]|nr:hypothetical protein EIK77_005123 [Talaromyces pinophilus]
MINNIVVRPGNNTVQIRGVANLTTILDNLKTILAQQSQYIQSGYLSLTTTITDISYNGSTIPYYTEEMGKVPLTAQTSILGVLLNSLQGSNITGLISSLEGSNNKEMSLRDALHNSTELELLARRHLNDLIKL